MDVIDIEQARAALANPNTPGATLQDIAAQYPNLWNQIAAHPMAYPDLLTWLDSVGDGSVKAAVAARLATAAPLEAITPTEAVTTNWYPDFHDAQTVVRPAEPPVYAPTPAPPKPGPDRSLIVLIVGVLVVLLAAGGAVWWLLRGNQTPTPAATQTPPTIPTVTVTQTAPPDTPAVYVTSATSTTTTIDPEEQALAALNAQVANDAPMVANQLQNQWTTLLSTKQLGVPWDGKNWTYQDIWNEYTQLAQQYPNALMTQGGAYSSFKLDNSWYITTSGIVFSTPDNANAWCVANGLPDDYCFAFRITNQPGTNSKHHR